MKLTIESRHLDGILILRSDVFEDKRGFFREVYRKDLFLGLGLPGEFLQDNHSRSRRGVLRGLHFQWDPPMGKLIRVTLGEAFVVAVDVRRESSTLGKWHGLRLSAEVPRQLWAPPGFATGFCVLSDFADVQYKCTALHNENGEAAVRWDDPALSIDWPVKNPLTSERDASAPTLSEWLNTPRSASINAPR